MFLTDFFSGNIYNFSLALQKIDDFHVVFPKVARTLTDPKPRFIEFLRISFVSGPSTYTKCHDAFAPGHNQTLFVVEKLFIAIFIVLMIIIYSVCYIITNLDIMVK